MRFFINVISVPFLEFKASVQHVQKGHPTLVTQIDLILQNWWEFIKCYWQSVYTVCLVAHTFHCILLFLQFFISSQRFWVPLVMADRVVLIIFTFLKRKLQRCKSVKSLERIFEKFSRGLPTMAGKQRKFWFTGPLKHLLHNSENKKHKVNG